MSASIIDLLSGTSKNPNAVLRYLEDHLIPNAVSLMNSETLPMVVPLFPEDLLPTNQRNLTDVRTRIGVLLEYEFAKAVNNSLPVVASQQSLALTYVVANQFPDLAFRSNDGQIGIRFEVKAIQTVAEEKSANFSTLIKDIRKSTDFVVVFLWEWTQHQSRNMKFPYIEEVFILDAYELAQMRDCRWLNSPPNNLQSARQGVDLTFAVNARLNSFNQEEGNFGKLMRIFDSNYESLLPKDVQLSQTLCTYYRFSVQAALLGLKHVGRQIAAEAVRPQGSLRSIVSDELPIIFLVEQHGRRLVVIGDRSMPRAGQASQVMRQHDANWAIVLNEKFKWTAYNDRRERVDSGTKPAGAKKWVREYWHDH